MHRKKKKCLIKIQSEVKFFNNFTVFGIIGGIAGTYTSIKGLATQHFAMPCYLRPFFTADSETDDLDGYLNCCGRWQNISRLVDNSYCNKYYDYYNTD